MADNDEMMDQEDQEASEKMRELLEFITTALVDDVANIEINEIKSNKLNILELKVAKSDVGKVIGKGGVTANAIRKILSCASAKYSKRFELQIDDS